MPPGTSVSGLAAEGGSGFWLSISDLAKHKGLSKQALAERVMRFEAAGKLTTRPGPGRSKLVNVAEFDHAVGEIGDLAREQGAATRRAAAAPVAGLTAMDPVYTQEQARKMAYAADREKIGLGRDLDLLVPVDKLGEEFARVLAPIARTLSRLSARADDVLAAVSEDGRSGARAFLDRLGIEISNMIADAAEEAQAAFAAEPARKLSEFDPRGDEAQRAELPRDQPM